MKIIYYPLSILIVLNIIGLFFEGSLQTVTVNRFDTDFSFSLDLSTISLYILIATVITAIIVVGFNILGSGYGDTAVHLITMIILYVGIWLILTPIAWSLIMTIKTIGVIIYFMLLIMYTIGVSSALAGSD